MLESRSELHGQRSKVKKSPRTLNYLLYIILVIILLGALYIYFSWSRTDEPATQAVDKPDTEQVSPGNIAVPTEESESGSSNRGAVQDDQDDQDDPSEQSSSGGNEAVESNADGTPMPVISTDENQQVHLTFVGDLLLAGNVEDTMLKEGYDYPYTYVKEYFENSDITIGNLETPVTENDDPQIKQYVFKSSPKALPALKAAGFDVLNLANNHILDQGVQGLYDTLEHVDAAGFLRVGAGKDADEAFRSVIINEQGIKIAFLGFSRVVPDGSWKAGINHPGVADTYDSTRSVEAIKKAKQEADIVIVITHWGKERIEQPVKEQTELAHQYIDAGADLIVGGHPHVLQGIEHYKNKWIAYSLGNFIFTTNTNPLTWNSTILEAYCTKQGDCSLQMVPILTKYAQPKVMDEAAAKLLYEHVSEISKNVQVQSDGKVQAK